MYEKIVRVTNFGSTYFIGNVYTAINQLLNARQSILILKEICITSTFVVFNRPVIIKSSSIIHQQLCNYSHVISPTTCILRRIVKIFSVYSRSVIITTSRNGTHHAQ